MSKISDYNKKKKLSYTDTLHGASTFAMDFRSLAFFNNICVDRFKAVVRKANYEVLKYHINYRKQVRVHTYVSSYVLGVRDYICEN